MTDCFHWLSWHLFCCTSSLTVSILSSTSRTAIGAECRMLGAVMQFESGSAMVSRFRAGARPRLLRPEMGFGLLGKISHKFSSTFDLRRCVLPREKLIRSPEYGVDFTSSLVFCMFSKENAHNGPLQGHLDSLCNFRMTPSHITTMQWCGKQRVCLPVVQDQV